MVGHTAFILCLVGRYYPLKMLCPDPPLLGSLWLCQRIMPLPFESLHDTTFPHGNSHEYFSPRFDRACVQNCSSDDFMHHHAFKSFFGWWERAGRHHHPPRGWARGWVRVHLGFVVCLTCHNLIFQDCPIVAHSAGRTVFGPPVLFPFDFRAFLVTFTAIVHTDVPHTFSCSSGTVLTRYAFTAFAIAGPKFGTRR